MPILDFNMQPLLRSDKVVYRFLLQFFDLSKVVLSFSKIRDDSCLESTIFSWKHPLSIFDILPRFGYITKMFNSKLFMSQFKKIYACQNCGATYPKWLGKCTACGTLW
jgi:hypothetical protein